MHALKQVDRPTTLINEDQIQRVDERESGFSKAGRGDFGRRLKKEYLRFTLKHPLSNALVQMGFALRDRVDGEVAREKAPLPEDPDWMAGHIKETAYFLRADMVGICTLPPYAVYSHSNWENGKTLRSHCQIRLQKKIINYAYSLSFYRQMAKVISKYSS